jgi:hypothetical protein
MTPAAPFELPDPFVQASGRRIASKDEWPAQRQHLLAPLLTLQYGPFPPVPDGVRIELLHSAVVHSMGGARLLSLRVHAECDATANFGMQVWLPPGSGPWPVVLTGDACWHYATDAVKSELVRRGYALAQFNRTELAADPPMQASTPRFAAIATWAWGYHRCVDALLQLDWVHKDQIAVVGHSRGGKAALLASATDERIALTSANNSGAGGAGCYRCLGPGAETLADIVRAFPHWFSPRLAEFIGKENTLPFDQHFLKALIAPRALLTTEALDDLWANPEGTWQTHLAAREVYRFFGSEPRLAIHWRAGGHEHALADWCTLLDFADEQFRGVAPGLALQSNPFPGLAPAFSWVSPNAVYLNTKTRSP